MRPALRDGDVVRVDACAYRERPPRPGDVVLARHPYRRDLRIIKRVSHLTAEGRVFVVGDEPAASTDSRSSGPLRPEAILGRADVDSV